VARAHASPRRLVTPDGAPFEDVTFEPLHSDIDFPVRWRHSARARRLSLRVDPATGHVIVTLPGPAHRASAIRLILSRRDWIMLQRQALKPIPAIADGTLLPYGDDLLTITHRPDLRSGTHRLGQTLLVSGDHAFMARRVIDFVRQEAQRIIPPAVRGHATAMNVAPSAIALRDVKSRWGSCTRTGRIMLSWRLVMAPLFVRDYVIIHELAHLTHFNHGPDFWKRVERFMPRRHEAEGWLRTHGTGLLRLGTVLSDE